MDKPANYRQYVQQIINEYSQYKPAYGEVELETIFDTATRARTASVLDACSSAVRRWRRSENHPVGRHGCLAWKLPCRIALSKDSATPRGTLVHTTRRDVAAESQGARTKPIAGLDEHIRFLPSRVDV